MANTDFPMVEITVEEMDRLKAEGDSQLWPMRFDKTRRFHPIMWEYGVIVWFENEDKLK